MGLWQRIKKSIFGDSTPTTKGAAVEFVGARPNSGGVRSVLGAERLAWFGDNIEGYDSLIGNAKTGVDFESYLPTDNSIVAACVNFITTSWSLTRLQVGRMEGDDFVPLEGGHPLEELIQAPHVDYDGNWLITAWVTDLFNEGRYHGNIVTAGETGPPKAIQYLPAANVEPKGSDRPAEELIGFYEYTANGRKIPIKKRSMIYGRMSLDPVDPKYGKKPLYCVRREIATDNLASEVAAAIMKKPVPSGVLTYDGDPSAVSHETLLEDMRETKQQISESSSVQNAGSMVMLPFKANYHQTSFNPKDMAIDDARHKPEERICAVFGIPPVVVGLGSGIKASTYNNLSESKKLAWTDCMIPLLESNADVLTKDVLSLYPGSEGLLCKWDTSQVGVLQPDMNAERKEAREDVKAGILTADEVREERGLKPMPESEKPQPVTTVPAGQQPGAKSLQIKRDSSLEAASRLYRVANAFRSALAKGETEAVDNMTALLNAAREDITSRLLSLTDWIEREEAKGVTPSENLTAIQTRWRELSEQLNTTLSMLAEQGADVVKDGQEAAVVTGVQSAERLGTAAHGSIPKGVTMPAWNTLPTDTLESLAGFLADGLPVNVYLSRVAGQYLTEVQGALFAGVARGAGAKEIARDMAKFGDGPRERFLTMVRTETNRAAREASRRSYEANSDVVDAYIRLSAADSRTCPACWGEHGKEYPTSDPMHQHVQCRCVLIPKTKSWSELTGIDNLPDTRPSIETGETIFAKLSSEAQEEILGPGRFALWSEGKAKLADFAERSNDPVWGPTLSTATVGNVTGRVQ